MKKSLILLGITGVATLAQAQSSVSITGTVDLYAQRVKGSLTSKSQLSSGGNSSGKLAFRGSEDLGGGLTAGFWLEAGFAADSGMGVATNTNNTPAGATTAAGLAFNRRSIVYLNGAFGELQLGRNWSPTYDTFTSRFDVFGVGSGIGLNYTASINPSQVRVSNGIAYVTPKFFGFGANIQHWFGEGESGTATQKDGSGDGIKLQFDQGPFGAVAAVARTHFATGDAIYRNAGVIYDFGSFAISGNLNRDQQAALKQKGALIGVRVPIGATEFKASYSRITTNADNSPTGQKYAVGLVYNLSKRTAAYTSLAHLRNSDGSALSIAGSTTAPNQSSTGFDLGIRHNF